MVLDNIKISILFDTSAQKATNARIFRSIGVAPVIRMRRDYRIRLMDAGNHTRAALSRSTNYAGGYGQKRRRGAVHRRQQGVN